MSRLQAQLVSLVFTVIAGLMFAIAWATSGEGYGVLGAIALIVSGGIDVLYLRPSKDA